LGEGRAEPRTVYPLLSDPSDHRERECNGLAPVDLAKSIVLEAAELLEHYQWDGTDIKKHGSIKNKDKHEIASEVADIFIYILDFCQENDIDLLETAKQKIEHNSKKYPAKNMKDDGFEAYYNAKKIYRKK